MPNLHSSAFIRGSFLLRQRRFLTEAVGAAIACVALATSFLLRFEFAVPPAYIPMLQHALPLAVAVKFLTFRAFGLRHLAWRYIGFDDLLRIAAANLTAFVLLTPLLRLTIGPAFPRSIYVLDLLTCLMLEVSTRAVVRMLFDSRTRSVSPGTRRVLIYGAGRAGVRVLAELRAQLALCYHVAGFLDDNPAKRDMRIHGVRIFGGRAELPSIASKLHAEEILIALPTASGQDLTEILEQCHAAHIPAKRIPALAEIIDDKVLVDQIREVRIEDLLGRQPARLDDAEVSRRLTGQVVLVTGAAGSIGSELCRQIARYSPTVLVGFDHAESALYEMEQELRVHFPQLVFVAEIGSIQNQQRVEEVFAQHRPRSVYHAAAYKHVPLMEAHLFEAVKNNVFGTRNVARAAASWGAENLVLISSDKAVRPANVMGATKRLAELVCLAEAGKRPLTKIVAVRFGNVLGSSGSVIPRFRQQIASGGPLTVTHPEMRRFFMTIPEAAQLVLEAGAMGAGGEIFVLEMGEPVRILDLARKMILLSGLRPDVDIRITFSGVRPGEKMCEELIDYEENTVPTPHTQIRVFNGPPPSRAAFECSLDQLKDSVRLRDAAGVVMCFKDLIPDYNPSSVILKKALRPRQRAKSVVA
ncbi:MAG: nucleoside-diphosphate sugar epimerase/dehydratase [Acidobacteriota bacterium]